VAFDGVGNMSTDSASYTITDTPDPVTPVLAEPVLAVGSVTLTWTVDDPSITGFSVQAYDAAGAPFENAQLVTEPKATITGLQAGESYTVRVTSINANGHSEPAITKAFTALGAVLADAGPDQRVKRDTKVTLDGRASTMGSGGSVKWEQVLTSPTDPNKVTLAEPTALTPSFTLPLYKYPMTNDALTFRLSVTDDGVTKTDEVKVSAIADQVTAVGPKWKAGDFRVSGSATTIGATITVAESITTRRAGREPRSKRVASAPEMIGIRQSINTTSGWVSAASRTISAPSAHSPTTMMSSARERTRCTPRRTKA